MSSYLRNNFIFHENGVDDLSYQQNLLFFDKKPIDKINNWEKIKEPSVPELDRHITGKNKVIKLTKKEEFDYIHNNEKEINISDINSMQINSKDEMEEINNSLKESIDRSNIKKLEKVKKVEKVEKIEKNEKVEKKEKKEKKKKYKIKKTFGEIVREKEKKEKELREKELKEKEYNKKIKKDKIVKKSKEKENKNINEDEDDEDSFVLPMTSPQDLVNIDNTYNFYNNSEENDLLRKEREELLIQKEKERLKEEERKKKEKKKKFRLQIKKNFESNILTFDPNGEIIRKRATNLDIIKKDFNNPKLVIKDNNNAKSLPIEKRRSILRPIKEHKNNNKNINKNNSQKEIVIFNPNDKITLFDFDKDKIKSNNNKEIKLSGNNFELVKPEVGVVISNEFSDRKKEGGFEYFKKYNKPSMKDYSKLSLFSGNLLSSYMYSNDSNIDLNNYKDENNYIGFKEEFNENNPLFQDVYKIPSLDQTKNKIKYNENNLNQSINLSNINILKNKKIFLKNEKNKNKNNLIHSYDSIKMNSNRYKNNNSYNSIKLNENIKNNNLKNLFTENEENSYNKKYNSIDIDSYSYLKNKEYIIKGKKGLKRRRELPMITENNGNKDILDELIDVSKIDKFNFRIIKNKKWGNDIDSDPLFQNRNRFFKLDNNQLQTDGNINIFRKGNNLSNRLKVSGVNAIYNRKIDKNKVKSLLKPNFN